ncbi:PepSY domain-containing protein [Parapedomonas caeni]
MNTPRTFFAAPAIITGLLVTALPATGSAAPTASDTPAPVTLRLVEPVGLRQAVRVAEEAVQGRALEAELDTLRGRPVYEVDVLRGRSVHRAVIDAQSGTLISRDRQVVDSLYLRVFRSDRLGAARTAERPLVDLIAAVETQTRGKVQEVSLDEMDGRLYLEMDVAIEGRRQEITVDPRSGTMILGALD